MTRALCIVTAKVLYIHLAKNPVYLAWKKHIQIQYHFIRSTLEDIVISLEKILVSQNPIDILKKMLMIDKLKLCSTLVGLQA